MFTCLICARVEDNAAHRKSRRQRPVQIFMVPACQARSCQKSVGILDESFRRLRLLLSCSAGHEIPVLLTPTVRDYMIGT